MQTILDTVAVYLTTIGLGQLAANYSGFDPFFVGAVTARLAR